MAPNKRLASGGMDEALRYNQQLQFCRQLEALQQQLCEETQLSGELLASVYALGKYAATPACVLQQLAAAFPEFASKLQRSIRQHPLRELHIEQMEGDAVEAVVAEAESLAAALGPMYKELQELGKFLVRASSLLADLHQLLIPVTMATAPQAIEFFMTLFCNTSRIVLLMERVPWRLVVQVYSIVTAVLDDSSPPGRTAVVELLERVAEPVPYLQALFKPISSRVSQVLELAVSPLLGHVASAQVLQESAVFDITRLGQTQLGITGMSLSKTYSFMQRLDDFRAWAMLGLLACPSALQGVGAQPLLAALLRESFLMPVHGDVVLPLHAAFEQHVTPALEQLTASLLDGAGANPSKQAQLQDARQLVGKCYAAAVADAEVEHAARRRLITRVLCDIQAALQDDVSQLPDALPMALAAQAYAKSELLWYMRHVGEALPLSPTAPAGSKLLAAAPLLGGHAKHPQLSVDGHMVSLVAATTGVFDLLEGHQEALQGQQLAAMRALLEQQVLPETAAVLAAADKVPARELPASGKERVVPQILLPLIKAVVYPLAEACRAVDVAGGGQQQPQQWQGQVAGTGPDPAAVLCDVQQAMVHLTMLLASRNLWMRPAVLEAPAQDPQYLEAIHRLLEWCPFALRFMAALDKSCCLAEVVHHQHKLRALQQHVLQGTSLAAMDVLPGCPCLVKVLHWFEHNPPVADSQGSAARDYAAEAKALASALLGEQCGAVAMLLVDRAQELGRGLYVTRAAPAAAAPAKGARTPPRPGADSARDSGGAADGDAAGAGALHSPGRAGADASSAADQWLQGGLAAATVSAGGAASATVRSRVLALAHALDAVGPVRVSSDRLVLPGEYLRAALQQWLAAQLNELVASAEVPPVPSQLVATLGDLLWATAELREVLSIDVTPDLWQVLLSHAQPHWVLPPASAAAAAALVGGGGGSAGARAAALRPWLLQPVSSAGRDQLNGAPSASAGGDGSSSVAASSAGGAAAGAASSAGASGPRGSGVPVPVVSMVQAYGEWFTQAVVRDARGLGVMFAPQLRQFVCLAGPADALSQRACLPELTALLQVFGPYAALRLCEMTDGVVVDCLGQLDGCLGRWRELLDPITLAVVRDDSCLDAVAAATAVLSDEGQVLGQARQLSRCLAFRQLLAEALTQALATTFPAAGATVDAVASNLAVHAAEGGSAGRAALQAAAAGGDWGSLVEGRHVCDVFDLPRPGLQGVGTPAVADPLVVNTLVGSNTYERYRAWSNLPTLLGLVLQSPAIGATAADMAQHALANELHALVHGAKCLALAQQAAANRVLPCGSAFLHPEAPDQAASTLSRFVKVATTVMYSRNDAMGVRACKQLMMESLACPQLHASKLADAWVAPTRTRSVVAQAMMRNGQQH